MLKTCGHVVDLKKNGNNTKEYRKETVGNFVIIHEEGTSATNRTY